MYKLVIIDDKPNVIEGIRRFGNWAERGIEVVGDAANGLEALKLIEATKPDIAITDIAMPLLDGLAFSEQAHKILPRLRIIILSGYDQFDYAQKALRLGAVDYLLKPVKIDQIVAAVERAKTALETEENVAEELLTLRRQNQKSDWQREINAFLEQPERWVELAQAEGQLVINRLGLNHWSPALRLVLFTPADLITPLEEFWQKTAAPERLVVTRDRYSITLADEAEAASVIETAAFQTVTGGFLLLSRPATNPADLPRLYAELLNTLELVEFNRAELTEPLLKTELLKPAALVYPSAVEREIGQCLQVGRVEVISDLVRKFYREAGKGQLLEPAEARSIGLRLLVECNRLLAAQNYEGELIDLYTLQAQDTRLRADLEAFLASLISQPAAEIAAGRQAKNKSAVERATEFIGANLHRDISLDDVATELHFTASYLANQFKKATGETVVEYISRVKMERAAEMVCDPTIKITSIAQALGFNDRRYFSELFRRKFGCTPSEYRDRFWLERR